MNRRRFLRTSAVAAPVLGASAACAAPLTSGPAASRPAAPRRGADGWRIGRALYENPLATEADVAGWVAEGGVHVSFPTGRLRLENSDPVSDGREAHFVLWCPETFPADVAVSWSFLPVREPGLAMVFLGARGRGGEDLFDPALAPRDGVYPEYHSGDLDALHASYFRRRRDTERQFQTVNLRKSHGFHLVAQGADPIPGVRDVVPDRTYRVQVVKAGPTLAFSIDGMELYRWTDDGTDLEGAPTGPPHTHPGKLGFRQMAPLMAEYADLAVHAVETDD
ncbi:MAG: DUF1961 family protein [Bacteroidota bacterium]